MENKILKNISVFMYMDHDGIYTIPNNLPSKLCEAIIRKFENEPQYHIEGKLGTGHNIQKVDKSIKDSTEIDIFNTPGWEKAGEKLIRFLDQGLDEYLQKYKEMLRSNLDEEDVELVYRRTLLPFDIRSPNIQRVTKGKKYRWHHDGGMRDTKVLTYMWYLNTIKPEDGGATEFIGGKSVQPEAGKLLIFPATWMNLHTGRLVKCDAKYTCVGNIHRDIP